MSIDKGEVFSQWKKAHLCPVFKKDDPTDRNNYNVPSKILESCISDTVLKHVTECELLTERQWAYRKGHLTQLLLAHLTESWRQAVDNNFVVATAFIDFRKAFDCVSHRTPLHKLKNKYGIEGNLLSWLTDYLNHRTQVTVVNSTQSEELNVSCGIPQGSVLGPCLFSLYTNDMPEAVTSGNLFLYADDTTVYCIGSTVDEACNLLNNALDELNKWCTANSLTTLFKMRSYVVAPGSFIGPHPLITIGNVNVAWVCHVRLLGITIDRKLTWKKHLKELKNNFVCKLNLLKKCSFLKKKSLPDVYFKVILPSVTYGITIRGNCNNLDYIKSLQALHCRAGRLIFNLPRNTPSDVVMELTQWDSIYDLYKLSLVKLFYNDNIPSTISDLAVWRNSPYDLRGYKKAVVPRCSTYFVKNSIRYKGAVLWNLVSDYFKDSCSLKQFHRKVQCDPKFREFRFISL